MNPREDSLGFPVGVMVAVFAYAIAWSIYQWGFSNGAESEECKRRHSYHFETALPAFAEAKK